MLATGLQADEGLTASDLMQVRGESGSTDRMCWCKSRVMREAGKGNGNESASESASELCISSEF